MWPDRQPFRRPDDTRSTMRIAYLIGSYPTRTQTFIRQEIEALRRLGHEVLPISVNPIDPTNFDPDERAEHARTRHLKGTPIPAILAVVLHALLASPRAFFGVLLAGLKSARWDLRRMALMPAYFVEALLVRDLCERHGLVHVHAHFALPWSNVAWLTAAFAGRVRPEAGWRWSLTIHGPHDFFDDPALALGAKIDSVARIVCISDHGRAQLMRQVDDRHWARLIVNRCGIDTTRLSLRAPQTPGPAIAAETSDGAHTAGTSSTPGTAVSVLTVGRLAPEKGQGLLIDAIALLRERGLDVHCTIVGDGPLRTRLQEAVLDLGLGDRVSLPGALPPAEVAARLRTSDIFCLPSFAEGVPISIMEAMAVGVPVVATNVGGVDELVVNGETGQLVPPGRADHLATAIADLLTDETLRARLVSAARARVVRDHDLDRNSATLARILEDCAC